MWRDLVYGVRQLRRHGGASLLAIALVGIGIGANTLVFSLVNELLLKTLPVRDPQNLYELQGMQVLQVRPRTFFVYQDYIEVVLKSPVVAAAVAEEAWYEADVLPMRAGNTVRLVRTQMVSPNYFTELGVEAYAGRVLNEGDADETGAGLAGIPAVLSFQFWQSQFGGDRSAIGRTIRLKDTPFRIVGVLPRDFHSSDIDRAPDIRLPISAAIPMHGAPQADPIRSVQTFEILLRLKPGVSGAHAAAALRPELQRLEEWRNSQAETRMKTPPTAEQREGIRRQTLEEWFVLAPMAHGDSQLRDQFARALRLLLGGVGLLLVAVCANVAGLLLVKSNPRRREMSIRLAVGAGRWQLVRQLLAEYLLLAIPGALLGASLAYALAPALIGLLPTPRDFGQVSSPLILTIAPDLRVLGFTALITVGCGLLFGLLPAWQGTGVSLAADLKAGRGQSAGTRTALAPVVVQVAFGVLLLAAAGLMLRTWRNLERLDAGFDRQHLIEFTPEPAADGRSAQQVGEFYRELRDRVAQLPGVAQTAYASRGVMRGVGLKMTVAPEGITLPPSTFLNTSSNEVSPEYFETMGIPLAAGRNLTLADAINPLVPLQGLTRVVVNRAFADLLFPHQNPIGKRLAQGTDGKKTPTWLVVGVVASAKYRSLREPDAPTLYTALGNDVRSGTLLYVRTHGSPGGIASAVRQAMAAIDPTVPLAEVITLDQEVETSLWQERLVAVLSAFFGGAAALLAAIGLYGSLAYSVEQRRREIGIRVAVGARFRHIVRAVCAPIGVAVGMGVAAGLAAATLLLRVTSKLLYGVQPLDPWTLALAAAFVCLCAAAAAAPPARRAGRIDPAGALREE